jgi:hypothetical protein
LINVKNKPNIPHNSSQFFEEKDEKNFLKKKFFEFGTTDSMTLW